MTDFNTMLDNLYLQLDVIKEEPIKFYLPEPKISKKSTRLDWINVKDFLKTVNRSYEHFLNFIKHERKVNASYNVVDGNNVLMIQGRIKKEDISKIMLEYTDKYTKCFICSSYNTVLVKDGLIKKDKIVCNKCKSVHYCN